MPHSTANNFTLNLYLDLTFLCGKGTFFLFRSEFKVLKIIENFHFYKNFCAAMQNSEIRVLMKYEFHRGTTTAQTARNINDVFGTEVTSQQTVSRWFMKFRSGNFDLTNEPRGRPETQVDNDYLKAVVEANPRQSASELSLIFSVTKKTILTHLAEIGKVKKLDKWVPHELSDIQKERRLEACVSLLCRYNNDPFLNRIVTCDEKWILYDNTRRSSQWLDQDEPPKHCAKKHLHQKKLMVSVWWSNAGVIHHSFMKPGESITADVYCRQLTEMMRQLTVKQPRLVNRSAPLLLHDNARPHTAQVTLAKLQEFELETLRHPPYSPDLAPTDYHFFHLDNFLVGKTFNSDEAVKAAFQEFIDSRPAGFYSRGINELPVKWQKCIDNSGAYFD
ncbi:histone-lysine N-methyltransferase SETMAR-like [Euwallacea similis]|uniref:histone-lysine N-methyltransferase SETMAR-like n=1 Tax=Euwallacea similis TaxID=1736056 RepID=UPI00344DAB6F